LLNYYQTTKQAYELRNGASMMNRFSEVFYTAMKASAQDGAITPEVKKNFFAACLGKDGFTKDNLDFIFNFDDWEQCFNEEASSNQKYLQSVMGNELFHHLLTMAAVKYTGNEAITRVDVKSAAFLAWYRDRSPVAADEAGFMEFLRKAQGELNFREVLVGYLESVQGKKIDIDELKAILQKLKIKIKDGSLEKVLDGKCKPQDFIEDNQVAFGSIYCNGWNHPEYCRCGFGGVRAEATV
jgi:hypothetical protein